MQDQTLVERLRKRAEIRRSSPTRKSVIDGSPDRLADLLEEAADMIETLAINTHLQKTARKDVHE